MIQYHFKPKKVHAPWAACRRQSDKFIENENGNLPAFEAEIDHLKQWLIHVKPYSSIHTSRLTWLQAYPPYHWGKYHESHQLVQSAFSLLSETEEKDPKFQEARERKPKT